MSVHLALDYDATNARVIINARGMLGATHCTIERSIDQVNWTAVRGCGNLEVALLFDETGTHFDTAGTVPQQYDYEFRPEVPNYYRLLPDTLLLAYDSFTRTVAAGSWGVSDTGHAYALTNTTTDFSVNGTKGLIKPHTSGDDWGALLDTGRTNQYGKATVQLDALPVDNNFEIALPLRATGTTGDDWYLAKARIAATTGAITVIAESRVGGTPTTIASVAAGTLTVGTNYTLEGQIEDTTIRVRFYTGAIPAWQINTVDVNPPPPTTGTRAGAFARNNATSTFTKIASFDDLLYYDLTPDYTSAHITPSIDDIWVKSLVYPFLNRVQTFVNGPAITVTRPARVNLIDVKNRIPVAVNDRRGSRRITVQIRTLTAEDAQTFQYLIDTGDPVFIHVPYGLKTIPGGYWSVGDVDESYHPLRLDRRTFTLPLTEIAAPGPFIAAALRFEAAINAAYPGGWSDVLADNPTWADLVARFSEAVGVLSEVIV